MNTKQNEQVRNLVNIKLGSGPKYLETSCRALLTMLLFYFSIKTCAVGWPILMLCEPVKQMGTACSLEKESQRKIASTKLLATDPI